MSRKWLENEGPKWVDQNIISDEQYQRILSQYDHKQQNLSILTVLGSVLVGLGILSFIAANWQQIPQFYRLILIVLLMCGFYTGGSALYRKGHRNAGPALLGLGLLSFGGGIFLIAQMYHLTSNSVSTFVVWSIAGLALLYLYGGRYLFMLTTVILTIAQFYSMIQFDHFSFVTIGLTILGLGYYALREKDKLLGVAAVGSTLIQSLIWLGVYDLSFFWIYILLAVFYTLGDLLQRHISRIGIQLVPLITAFAVGTWFAFMDFPYRSLAEVLAELPIGLFCMLWIILFAVSMGLKYRNYGRAMYSLADWILLLPAFLIGNGNDWLYLILLFIYALFVLLDGYRVQNRVRVNIGTLLFLFITLLSYMKLTRDFMDKSLMFITGGCILFGLSWLLNRRRKQMLNEWGGKEQ